MSSYISFNFTGIFTYRQMTSIKSHFTWNQNPKILTQLSSQFLHKHLCLLTRPLRPVLSSSPPTPLPAWPMYLSHFPTPPTPTPTPSLTPACITSLVWQAGTDSRGKSYSHIDWWHTLYLMCPFLLSLASSTPMPEFVTFSPIFYLYPV